MYRTPSVTSGPGTLRPGDYLRSLRGVDTEAVFSLRDPLPSCYEIALLPYLAFKRGLLPAEMRGNRCLKRRIPLASSTTSASRTPCGREPP